MGLELAAAIVGLTLVGLWVDHQFGTGSKGLIIGATLGVVGGFYNFLRQALLLSKTDGAVNKDDDADQRNDTTHSS
jgi:F0F1-type ATP synthase assembly protein I